MHDMQGHAHTLVILPPKLLFIGLARECNLHITSLTSNCPHATHLVKGHFIYGLGLA